jgi:hypothetical protein
VHWDDTLACLDGWDILDGVIVCDQQHRRSGGR